METWHALTSADALVKLGSEARGLTHAEAASRLLTCGRNALPEAAPDSYLRIFARQFVSPLIYLLFAAAVVLYFTHGIADAAIILIVLVLNAGIGAFQEGRAQGALRALRHFAETTATVVREGQEAIIPDAEVVPGDIILLQEGARVPADARVITARTLRLDESSLTGESMPVTKREDSVRAEAALADQLSMVFRGANVVGGTGTAVVVATGTSTEIGKIAAVIAAVDTDVPLKKNIRDLSRMIIICVGVGCALLFLAGLAYGHSIPTMFAVAVSLAVSVIPEGLPVVMTLVLATGVRRMGKRHVLVKKLQAVDALGQATVIAVDKTGTITRNELTVESLWADSKEFGVTGAGYEPVGSITLKGETVDAANHPDALFLAKLATLCANAETMYAEDEKRWRVAGDPTEAALLVLGKKLGFTKLDLEHEAPLLDELPFDYVRKYHATLHDEGGKKLMSVVGAPEAVLALCTTMRSADGKEVPFTEAEYHKAESALHAQSRRGLRVIALAYRYTSRIAIDEKAVENLVFAGFVAMEDALRPEVKDATERARSAGIRVVMITGDHKLTALAIALAAGIADAKDQVITGAEIDSASDAELARMIKHTSVFARVTPEHKLRIIRAFRANGDIIAMTGDGVNDAPSLVAADLGVSMGIVGTEVAKEASDLVLMDDNFGSIVSAVEEGRSVYKTVKKVVLYLFSTSVGEALTIAAAIFAGLPLPLAAAQLIWLNFVTDGFLTVALGMEPKEKNLLRERFVRPSRYLVDRLMLERIFVLGIPMGMISLYLFTQYLTGDFVKASTVALTTLAIIQWFNAWNCRSETRSVFTMNPFGNPYLIAATLAVALLHVFAVTQPFMQKLLHTTSLTMGEWLACIVAAAAIIFIEEVRKLAHRLAFRAS